MSVLWLIVIPSTFYGFFSITLIAFIWFCSYLHHTITIRQCMFERKIGAEGSVLQEFTMPLSNSYNKMFVLWLIVHTLWNQLLLELSLDLFNTLQIRYRHIENVHEEVWCWKNIFWQTYGVFNIAVFRRLHLVNYDWSCILCEINLSKSFHWIFLAFCRYVTDILKMCMKEFDAETMFFKKLTGPLT